MAFWPWISYSDSPTDNTFHQLFNLVTDIDLHRITSSFHGTFATSMAYIVPAGDTYPYGHLVLSPFCGLVFAPIVETRFHELAVSFSTFRLEYPLVGFVFKSWIDLNYVRHFLWKGIWFVKLPPLSSTSFFRQDCVSFLRLWHRILKNTTQYSTNTTL